jgi:hypothetical protein
MSLLLILLIVIGPFLVVSPGLLVAAVECPEFFGRPSRPRPVAVVRRWQVA